MMQPPSGSHRAGSPPDGTSGHGGGSVEPRRPRKRTLLPWLIGAAVLLVAGLGTLLLVLLDGDAGDRRGAEEAAVLSSGEVEPARSSTAPVDGSGRLAGGTRVGGPAPADDGLYPGSGEVALTWVEAMGRGDFRTSYDLSCTEVQEAAVAAALADEDPAQVLGDYFYAGTLGGREFTGGTFDGVEHRPRSATDVASFTLELGGGELLELQVHVDAAGTVCDFR